MRLPEFLEDTDMLVLATLTIGEMEAEMIKKEIYLTTEFGMA